MLQRKKPMTRKSALRAKKPLRAKHGFRSGPKVRDAVDQAVEKLRPLLATRTGPPFSEHERIGPYRADFACPAARLVILFACDDDPARHDWFTAQDYRVLSFAADAVAADPEQVLDALAAAFTLRVIKS